MLTHPFNKTIEAYLNKIQHSQKIPHLLLFAGPDGSKKEETALAFAKGLLASDLETHPDLCIYKPEGKLGMHAIDEMRRLRDEVYMPPFQAKRKVFIIFDAERMLATSSNALLKTFEEPSKTSTILLLTSFPEKLLLTVRSRAQILYFKEETAVEEPVPHPLLIELLRKLCDQNYPEMLDGVKKLSESILNELKTLESEGDERDTAYQKQLKEKQTEGQEALLLLRLTESLWQNLLYWFRDLTLLQVASTPELVYHKKELETLIAMVQLGNVPSLDAVHKLVDLARRSLSRSSPLQNVLESLFVGLSRLPVG